MMEILLAVAVFGLAAAGIGLGLAMGRGPARSSCGASEGLPESLRCTECPLRRHRMAEGSSQ